MALIDIVDGPSLWDLLLAGFDRRPRGPHRVRTLFFTLKGGHEFWMELRGIIWPSCWDENSEVLTVIGQANTRLPRGYRFDGEFPELTYNPKGGTKAGTIELDLISPCCGDDLRGSLMGIITLARCAACDKVVARNNPRTEQPEWLDGEPVNSTRQLRLVGCAHPFAIRPTQFP